MQYVHYLRYIIIAIFRGLEPSCAKCSIEMIQKSLHVLHMMVCFVPSLECLVYIAKVSDNKQNVQMTFASVTYVTIYLGMKYSYLR